MDNTSHIALAASNADLSMIPTVGDDHGNDDLPQPQDFMDQTDDDGNGTLSLDEWIDFWNECIMMNSKKI
jgi:hypothetical protein